MTKMSHKEIDLFLSGKYAFPIFARPYSIGMILACYLAYNDYLKYECDLGIENALIHKRADQQFEFYVSFGSFSADLVTRLNNKDGLDLIESRVNRYFSRIEQFKRLSRSGGAKNLFWLAVKILAFEAHSFIVPYIEYDMGMHFDNSKVVDLCSQARLKTEDFFTPGGFMDNALHQNAYMPRIIKGYIKNDAEFLVYNHEFIYDTEPLNHLKFKTKISDSKELKGNTAFPGLVKGKVRVLLSSKKIADFQQDEILVASGTTPDYLPAIKKAAAIITNEGGCLCHAAIVSREFKIPCVVGTKNATKQLKDGDIVEVDANRGIVTILDTGC